MDTMIINDMRAGYISLVRHALAIGDRVAPRGIKTRELLDGSFILTSPMRAVPLGVGRKLSLAVAAVEAAQLIAGQSRPELMVRINPTFRRFATEDRWGDLHFHGAYGPRLAGQIPNVVDLLTSDPDSRQAVTTVYDGQRDFVDDPDIPCTLSLHFLVRDGRLQLHVTMRSNDLWWGVPYDVFQFTQLQLTVAAALRLPPGPYFHRATSLHLYERDVEAAQALELDEGFRWPFMPIGIPSDTISGARRAARGLLHLGEHPEVEAGDLGPSERWYLRHLRYKSPRAE